MKHDCKNIEKPKENWKTGSWPHSEPDAGPGAQTVNIIGKLKKKESKLLKENSLLTMELSKVSSKKWLLNFLKEGAKIEKKL